MTYVSRALTTLFMLLQRIPLPRCQFHENNPLSMSALDVSAYLNNDKHDDNVPARIDIGNRYSPCLAEAVSLRWNSCVAMSDHPCPEPKLSDLAVGNLPKGSLIINAAGMGKDRPGSPRRSPAYSPGTALLWEFN